MFRKTTAIAVLILLVSSLFAGSVTITPAREQTVIDQAEHSSEFAWLAPATVMVAGGMACQTPASQTYATGGSDTDTVPVRVIGGFMHPGIVGAEFVTSMLEAGMLVNGEPDDGYRMVVLTNESRIEVSGHPVNMFTFNGSAMNVSGGIISSVHKFVEGYAEPVKWTLHVPVIMTGPGGVTLERYDTNWESRHTLTGAAGEVGIFDAHLEMPWPDGSDMGLLPPDIFFSDGGVIQFNGTMVLNTANLTITDDRQTEASPYNNQITGGQTNWHKVDISNAVESFNIDLKWLDPDSKLRLLLYAPDGKVLGPYYDDSDGKTDGRINLNIANPSGVASGEWHLKVTDLDDLGNDDYYVKTY